MMPRGRPKGSRNACRLRGWRGTTVTVEASVHPSKFAGRTGTIVALSQCQASCANHWDHDELGVAGLAENTVWFRASELVRTGPEIPGSISSASAPSRVARRLEPA